MAQPRDPERLLAGLNAAQREAVTLTSGPLAIIAGAGSGKTRVISHRAAYAIETGVVPAERILLVTFTEKAAAEMVDRVATLGHRGVAARTFHAHALSQLRHYWPSRHEGETAPRVLRSKLELIVPIARRLPGHYRFTPAKDLADAIEWAKIRRIEPGRWHVEGGDRAPIPVDLFARAYADYERAKARSGVIDFEDMLVETVRLLESDEEAAATVRARKTWFSVDEYQDTNPLAERLLELWLGESRDLAVVGDPDQTIYSFTGATPDYLLEFEQRHPGARVVALVENYRSTPQILALANRLIAPGPRGALQATLSPGPAPAIRRHADDEAERTAIVGAIKSLLGQGIEPGEIAILVRINAQLPDLEQALTRAAIAFRVRGQRFFERREVSEARRLLARLSTDDTGAALLQRIRSLFEQRLGLGDDTDAAGDEARERQASLELILSIVADRLAAQRAPIDRAPIDRAPADAASADAAPADRAPANGSLSKSDVIEELDRRDAEEAAGTTAGVNLLTYHRAKGLEWDAVFLPALEEGLLPIRQAKEADTVEEERRLLYVGITRARRHLALSWASRRVGQGGKEGARKPSRFLDALDGGTSGGAGRTRPNAGSGTAAGGGPGAPPRRIAALEPLDGAVSAAEASERRVLEALQGWRRDRARADAAPAYVVAHDAMLFAIAEARPQSISALARVKGMGPAKLERYGAEILEIVTRAGPSSTA